jgi:hypothetical protein
MTSELQDACRLHQVVREAGVRTAWTQPRTAPGVLSHGRPQGRQYSVEAVVLVPSRNDALHADHLAHRVVVLKAALETHAGMGGRIDSMTNLQRGMVGTVHRRLLRDSHLPLHRERGV